MGRNKSISTVIFLLMFALFCPTATFSQIDPTTEWNELYVKIRDGLISREEARAKLKRLETELKARLREGVALKQNSCLVFPLKGYDGRSIGGKGGSGYLTQNYDFFDGNKHKGHPGHDLFIRDKNQDSLDDATGEPVEVVSASSGVVVSVNLHWTPSSPIRGGNYIWIYEPIDSRYVYYAHLKEVRVEIGQRVIKGNGLGTLGRTGVNACMKRSPTHLHFTVHQSEDGYPKPINPYLELIRGCEK